MAGSQTITITLTDEAAALLRDKVASGLYGGESEVVAEALLSLTDRDQTVEDWLRDVVVPAYDAWQADPSQTITLDEICAEFQDQGELSDPR